MGNIKQLNQPGGKYDYLGMLVNFKEKGKAIIDMVKYVESMVEDFPVKICKISKTPAAENLLDISTGKLLNKANSEIYHTTVAKGLFLCKRSRPDIQPTIAVLSTRVKSPTESDWKKIDKNAGIFKRNFKVMFDIESRQPTSGKMVCGCIFCSASRL